MKKLYASFFILLFFLLLMQRGAAQCSAGSQGVTAYDTTIRFPTGATNMQVKFPKFDPQTAMLSCVKLIVTIVGVVDSVAMQNYSGSPQTADFYYDRSDFMMGPGLTPSLSNTFSGHYGPHSLAPYDGLASNGPDFYSTARDTVLKRVMTRTLTDSTEISQFYGSDSVTYNYNINVTTSASITGGSSSSMVLTSALVNFRFEYCTCPLTALPLGLKNFTLIKANDAADLQWQAEAGHDNYYYEVEMSRDGRSFSKVALINKQAQTGGASYRFNYAVKSSEFGRYYFRVRQRWFDGYYKYSEIKSVEFVNPLFSTVSIYPNPSHGHVGIKFISAKSGQYTIQISNAAGQTVVRKDLQVASTDYKQLATLQKGIYYIKITELSSASSTIQQLSVQ